MAGGKDIEAGKAFIRLYLKNSVEKDLRDVSKLTMARIDADAKKMATSYAALGTAVTAAAATVVAGIAASVNNFVTVGGAIDDLNARTGASVTQLQTWKFAAEQSGASAEDLEKALRTMAKDGMSPSQFEQLGTSIAAIEDPGQRAAAAMEAFGKSGTKLLPMFRDLTDLKARSEAIGPILTPEEVAMADKLGDSFGVLRESLSRLANQIAVAFGPTLLKALQGAIGAIATVAEGIREIKNANVFSRGGDWLDKVVELQKKLLSPEELISRGAAATAGGGSFGGSFDGAARGPDGVDSLGRQFDLTKSITDAERKRLALMQEFLTPQERFLQKQQEIFDALKQVNNNRVMKFISPEQAALEKRGLEVSLQRLRAAERERQAKLAPRREAAKPGEKIAEENKPQFAVSSATTAAGAFALQSGSANSIAGKSYSELREMKKHLAEISRRQRESEARRERPGIFR